MNKRFTCHREIIDFQLFILYMVIFWGNSEYKLKVTIDGNVGGVSKVAEKSIVLKGWLQSYFVLLSITCIITKN